jgi:hypothetical protein
MWQIYSLIEGTVLYCKFFFWFYAAFNFEFHFVELYLPYPICFHHVHTDIFTFIAIYIISVVLNFMVTEGLL